MEIKIENFDKRSFKKKVYRRFNTVLVQLPISEIVKFDFQNSGVSVSVSVSTPFLTDYDLQILVMIQHFVHSTGFKLYYLDNKYIVVFSIGYYAYAK